MTQTEKEPMNNDMRRSARSRVSHTAPAEHRALGEIMLSLVNISTGGFMVGLRSGIERGDRLLLALPRVGGLQALCIWTRKQQAGFLFERPIPEHQFVAMLDTLKLGASRLLREQVHESSSEGVSSELSSDHFRKSERKRALAFASLCMPTGWEKVRVRDYSNSGARVVSENRIPVGVDIIFKRAGIFAAANVVWSVGNEAGLKFYRDTSDLPALPHSVLSSVDGPCAARGKLI